MSLVALSSAYMKIVIRPADPCWLERRKQALISYEADFGLRVSHSEKARLGGENFFSPFHKGGKSSTHKDFA